MKELYTINFFTICDTKKATMYDINYNGENMNAFFCENEKGCFVIIGACFKTSANRSCGHWHSGSSMYRIFYRKNFHTREEGNKFFKTLKKENPKSLIIF